MKMTVKQFALAMGVEDAVASPALRFLTMIGQAKEVGTVPSSSGKGKPAKLYEMAETLTISIPVQVPA